MNRFASVLFLSLLLISTAALGQVIGGNASIDVTTTSARVALPVSTLQYPATLIAPAAGSTAEIFYSLGGSSVTASTSGPALPANGVCFQGAGGNTNVAAITSTGTATLRITQLTQCPIFP